MPSSRQMLALGVAILILAAFPGGAEASCCGDGETDTFAAIDREKRRIDPLVDSPASGLSVFLAEPGGVSSGLRTLRYTTASPNAENRRLATPASLGGGISAMQMDIPTRASQTCDLQPKSFAKARATDTCSRRIHALRLAPMLSEAPEGPTR